MFVDWFKNVSANFVYVFEIYATTTTFWIFKTRILFMNCLFFISKSNVHKNHNLDYSFFVYFFIMIIIYLFICFVLYFSLQHEEIMSDTFVYSLSIKCICIQICVCVFTGGRKKERKRERERERERANEHVLECTRGLNDEMTTW